MELLTGDNEHGLHYFTYVELTKLLPNLWSLMLITWKMCRNMPKIIDALSADGSSGQQIQSSNLDLSSGA